MHTERFLPLCILGIAMLSAGNTVGPYTERKQARYICLLQAGLVSEKPMVLRESQSVSCPWFARGEMVVTGLILLPAEDCC